MKDRELLDLGNKAAHPYRMPIHGKWQMEWLKRFVSLVRMEFYKDDILTDAYMAGFYAGRDDALAKAVTPVDIEAEVRADIDRQLNALANETLISSYEKKK